jgi:hypothetical protein
MSVQGQTRSFGFVGSMSGLPESGHGWAIYEPRPSILTALSALGAIVFSAMLVMLLAEARDAYRRRR